MTPNALQHRIHYLRKLSAEATPNKTADKREYPAGEDGDKPAKKPRVKRKTRVKKERADMTKIKSAAGSLKQEEDIDYEWTAPRKQEEDIDHEGSAPIKKEKE